MNGRNALSILLVGLLLAIPGWAGATTRYVVMQPIQTDLAATAGITPFPPYDFILYAATDIQDALDYCAYGDTVLIAGAQPEDTFNGYLHSESIVIPNGVVVLGGWDVNAAIMGLGSMPAVDQRIFAEDSLWTIIIPAIGSDDPVVRFAVDSTEVYDTTTVGEEEVIDSSWVHTGVDSTTVLRGLFISDGNTEIDGAGILLPIGSPRITRNVFSSHTTSERGGAIFIGYGSPRIEHNTFASNYVGDAAGGIVHVAGGAPIIRDNIFSGNSGPGYAVACSDSAGAPVLGYNLFYRNNDQDTLACSGDGSNLFGVNPVYCASADNDYRLFRESPIAAASSEGDAIGAWGIGCRATRKYVAATGATGILPYNEPDRAALTLSAALDVSYPGDTILVTIGEFEENLEVPGGIRLSGSWDYGFNFQDPYQSGTVIRSVEGGESAIRLTGEGTGDNHLEYLVLTDAGDADGALLSAEGVAVTLEHISVVGNISAGASLIHAGAGASLDFDYCMFALNQDAPVFGCGGGSVTVRNSNFFENDEIAAAGCAVALIDTTRRDPFFCDPDSADYRVYSEGRMGESAPGLSPFGALSVGCNYSAHYVRLGVGDGVYPYETPEKATSDVEAAIDVASAQDTIRMGSGVYEMNLTIDKGVGFEGGWTDSTFLTRDYAFAPSILQGTAAGEPTVRFEGVFSQFAPSGGLDGFIITHAEGVEGPGVVVAEGARPRLRHNLITGNHVDYVSHPEHPAAGVVIQGIVGGSQAVPILQENTIAGNTITGAVAGNRVASGVSISEAGTTTNNWTWLLDNIISDNAGGIAAIVNQESWIRLDDNIIFDNTNINAADSSWADYSFYGEQVDDFRSIDPLFCGADSGNYYLTSCSPAIVSATGDTVTGALPVSPYCICDGEVFLVNPSAGASGFPFRSRRNAARHISDIDPYFFRGDTISLLGQAERCTVKVCAGAIIDSFTLVNGVKYRGGYVLPDYLESSRNPADPNKTSRIGGGARNRIMTAGPGVDSTTVVDGFEFAAGRADKGSGAYLYGDAAPVFSNNKFIECRSTQSGVIYSDEESSPRIIGNRIYNNSVDTDGGVIHLAGAGGVVANNTVSDNKGGGWAFIAEECAPDVYNNAFTYNDQGIRTDGAAAIHFDHNDVFYHDPDYEEEMEFDTTGQGNISQGPLYCARGRFQYTLFDHSPLVAAGRNGGNMGARPVGCSTPRHYVSEAGANEYPYDTAVRAAHRIQDAVDVASMAGFSNPNDSADVVLVAAGTYEETLRVPTNVKVYGGYNASFSAEQRDYRTNVTVIDAGGEGTAVVIDSGARGPTATATVAGNTATIFDGFTIRNGQGVRGGGIRIGEYAKPVVRYNRIEHCRADLGGGILVEPGAKGWIVYNTVVEDTAVSGAGLFAEGYTTSAWDTTWHGGEITGVNGLSETVPLIANNTFVDCEVEGGGAGVVHLDEAEPIFRRSIVAYNGGGAGLVHVYDLGGHDTALPQVYNNQFYSNAGGDSLPDHLNLLLGEHVIAPPAFCDTAEGAYTLLYDRSLIRDEVSPVRDSCAATIWGSEPVGCTYPGHRFLAYWDPNSNNRPIFPYVCAPNAARNLDVILPYVNSGDTVDVAGDSRVATTTPPLEGALYTGNFQVNRPIVLRGGFDAGFALSEPKPDSVSLQAVLRPRTNGSILVVQQDPAAATDSTLRIDSTTIISGLTFQNANAELVNGGAIRCIGGASPTIRKCSFEENSTKNWGGAISIRDAASPRILDSYFYRNRAGVGGAIYLYRVSDPVVRGNIFSENGDPEIGQYGGVRIEESTAGGSVDNNVFYGNRRGALSLSEAKGGFRIWNNVIASNGGYGISLTPVFEGIQTPVLSHNDLWANSEGNLLNIDEDTTSIHANPQFCNTGERFDLTNRLRVFDTFFRYQECSPMLLAGVDPLSERDAHIGVAKLSEMTCADTTAPALEIGFLLHSTLPGVANLYVIPNETIARDSILLQTMYANARLESVDVGGEIITQIVYDFDTTDVEVAESDAYLSVYTSRNITLQTADTLIVQARAVDLCGKVGTRKREFSAKEFSEGGAGKMWSVDRVAELDVPSGALMHAGVVLMEKLGGDRFAEGETPLAGPYHLSLEQVRPAAPLGLRFTLAGGETDAERFAGLAVYRWDGERWTRLESLVDPASRTVSASIETGGTYVVLWSEDVRSGEEIPARFALHPNMPNPFNPITRIAFDLPVRAEVSLRVYDVSGRSVRTLRDGTMNAGRHEVVWDGTNNAGRSVASGIYFYRIDAGDEKAVRKMTLIR
ncbi:MAG: right-handed parallel beta-helix repeat-containing protein [Candidatus Eisenbacteria bacterium]|nr:right-handed parallel beta-helix repeat-containing protein [Candidatus Eisenbacteria bacterium]